MSDATALSQGQLSALRVLVSGPQCDRMELSRLAGMDVHSGSLNGLELHGLAVFVRGAGWTITDFGRATLARYEARTAAPMVAS